jgi:hypothetical protein
MSTLTSRTWISIALAAFAIAGATIVVAAEEPAKTETGAAKPASNPLHLTAEQRDRAGIKLARPEAQTLAPEVEAYGRVLDPTPYAALVAEAATARAALTASEKELERVQKLFAAGGNASAQSVEAAEAAAARDRAAWASADIRLVAGWGSKLARVDLGTLRETLTRGAALVRIDLLPGVTAAAAPERARIALLGAEEQYDVEVLGPAPVADAQVQGLSFLAWLRGHSLPAGAALRVTLPGSGEAAPALLVPRTAIVYHEGSAWLYVLGRDDTFSRERVTLGRSVGDRIVVASGVEADAQVAISGGQQLLSAELQAGGAGEE